MKVFFIDIKNLPQSRWEIFNDFEPTLTTDRAKYFWKAIKILLRLGLYIFGQWLYDDIAPECSEVERYILEASFKLFTNQLENFTIVKDFPIDYLPNATTLVCDSFDLQFYMFKQFYSLCNRRQPLFI